MKFSNHTLLMLALLSPLALPLSGCKDANAPEGGTHVHEDGTTHTDHAPAQSDPAPADDANTGEDHAHAETALDPIVTGGMKIEAAQGHGGVAAGRESHLVVKLPYTDGGETLVRAWIGSADRTLSYVGKGVYAPTHDDYDIHATAPDPLPEGAMWWVEIEKPDGTKHVGSTMPIIE